MNDGHADSRTGTNDVDRDIAMEGNEEVRRKTSCRAWDKGLLVKSWFVPP